MELWDIYDRNRALTGRTAVRGEGLKSGEYHLVVHVWIMNRNGEFLITKRTPNKTYPLQWECTGGSALAGESSLEAALREVREETGLTLNANNGGRVILQKREIQGGSDFCDIWLFIQQPDISCAVLQEGETCDIKWASQDTIRRMIVSGEFVPVFDYIERLFNISEALLYVRQDIHTA
ncbi:MAG: NUDIX domain-containing protein [Eubacteriales bacterium]